MSTVRKLNRMRRSFSVQRWWSIVLKEFLQLRRDRVTFGMIVGLPIVQLLLFGFAINSDPRHMPTAVIVAEHSDFSRTFIAALDNTTYFKVVRTMPDEAAGREALLRGDVQFVVSIPADFSRRCCMATGQRSWSRPTPPIPPRRARPSPRWRNSRPPLPGST
jgi:ABC-2 type transport system permease protein